MPRPRRWDDEQLVVAVAASRSLAEVARRLGLRVGGGTYASLRAHIRRLDIDDAHLPVFEAGRLRASRKWSDDDLRVAVRDSVSVAEVQRRLGYRPSGGMHRYIRAHIRRLALSTEHFSGQGWAAGRRTG